MNYASLKIIEDLEAIPATDWNALAGNNPFLSHAYLHALQASGCATAQSGWQAQFITLWQDNKLVGAMPLYVKTNSYGEHVFDFAWADAYHRNGLHYYPKLVCTVPFTPVTGARLLAATAELRGLLLKTALNLAEELAVSSLHCLFLNGADTQEAQSQGMMMREDVQFHWHNPGYRHFDDYLAGMGHDKRKRIKQERSKIKASDIHIECISGEHATPEQWKFFASCYAHTRQQHHSPPALNEAFFLRISAALPGNMLLVIASRNNRPIASALNLLADGILYGRSWGAFEFHSGLHFEVCYYQAIEFCIARGIKTFEGGAGGEHKLARGFLPVITRSAHWLARPEFSHAVEKFLEHEAHAVAQYVDELNERSPFKHSPDL